MQTVRKFRRMKVGDSEDARLLSRAIIATGLSVGRFAALIVRDSRTVFRWLTGKTPLPHAVRSRCIELIAEHEWHGRESQKKKGPTVL